MTSPYERTYFEHVYRDYQRQNPPRKMRFYRGLARRVLRDLPHPRVLDLGCASGKFLASLDSTWHRYGLDVSEFAIQQARMALPGATLSVGSATDIPFDGPFDLITAFDLLEHVPAPDLLAEAVIPRLAPHGHFIFVVPVYDGLVGAVARYLDRDPTHTHKWSRSAWLAWTTTHFRLSAWCGIFRYLLPWGQYLHVPTTHLIRLTPAIAVTARRVESRAGAFGV